MSLNIDRVTRVSLESSPDYLPRIRRITSCLAGSVGMRGRDVDDMALLLNEACVNAIRHGSPNGSADRLSIAFRSSPRTIVADVTDCGVGTVIDSSCDGLGLMLMRKLSGSLEFIGGERGLTVRLTKSVSH